MTLSAAKNSIFSMWCHHSQMACTCIDVLVILTPQAGNLFTATHHVTFKSLPVGHLIPGLRGYKYLFSAYVVGDDRLNENCKVDN